MRSFERAAYGKGPLADPTIPGVANIQGGAVQISRLFVPQSFFDSTLLEKAILAQLPNQPIINGKEEQFKGYSIGLHPSSQTPVAVQIKGSDSAIILKPGQVVCPGTDGFEAFTWGLPYGWLGGGTATLLVFRSKDGEVEWPGNPEVIFHRARYAIKQPADIAALTINNASKNWPGRFPWPQALQGSSSLTQKGQPQIAVEPTRMLMLLVGATALAAQAEMQIRIQASNEDGLNSAGAIDLTIPSIMDTVNWPIFARIGTDGNMRDVRPSILYAGVAARVAADNGGIVLVDTSNAGAGGDLTELFVDIIRYGRL
jgi:hypothetical protein